MTDNEIIKALECCTNNEDCLKCPLQDDYADCNPLGYAFDLINRQQSAIEQWRYNLECVLKERADHSDAIEEFAERFLKIVHDNHYVLVDRINSKDYGMFTIGIEQAVDETKKEMVGEE